MNLQPRWVIDWKWLAIAAVVGTGLLLNLALVDRMIAYWHGPAWGWSDHWAELIQATSSPDPYVGDGYRWSPIAAWLLAFLLPMGIGAWRALHFAVLLLLRDWRVIAMGLVLIMPRPLFFPVAVWLLWKQPAIRVPALGLLLLTVARVAWSGLGAEWIGRLASTGAELRHAQNLAPSHWVGAVWVPMGVFLAVFLMWRGHLGLASLAASPYLFGYYLLFGLLELAHPLREGQSRSTGSDAGSFLLTGRRLTLGRTSSRPSI